MNLTDKWIDKKVKEFVEQKDTLTIREQDLVTAIEKQLVVCDEIFREQEHEIRYLKAKIKAFIRNNYPNIKEDDMVEILETRSFELVNSWSPTTDKYQQLTYLYEKKRELEDVLKTYIDFEAHNPDDTNIVSINRLQDELREIRNEIKELSQCQNKK